MNALTLLITIFVLGVTSTEVDFLSYHYFEQEVETIRRQQALSTLKDNGITLDDVENAFPFYKLMNTLRFQLKKLGDIQDEVWEQFKVTNETGISNDCTTDVSQIRYLPKKKLLQRNYS